MRGMIDASTTRAGPPRASRRPRCLRRRSRSRRCRKCAPAYFALLLNRVAAVSAEQCRHLPALLALPGAGRRRRRSGRAADGPGGGRRMVRTLRLLHRTRLGRVLVLGAPLVVRMVLLVLRPRMTARLLFNGWLRMVSRVESFYTFLLHLSL